MTTTKSKRVLQVVGCMARAGVETWLMHVLRRLDPGRVKMDFLVHTRHRCEYDAEIESRGCRIWRCPERLYSPAYARRVAGVFEAGGPYDVVHSHVHHFSGYLLWLARMAGVRDRIAHSHSDTSRQDRRAGWPRSQYLNWAKRRIRRNATRLAAASRAAGEALYGTRWTADGRRLLLHCGIDLTPFRTAPDRSEVRATLGIREDAFVVGHVGRFASPKNHLFLLDVATEIARVQPETRLLLVGDGPLRPQVEDRARERDLLPRVLFAGSREDVPALLQAMDVFVFPSLWEGLPLTLLETQAAGLPCVLSDVISEEVDVVPELCARMPLDAGSAAWAKEAIRAAGRRQGRNSLAAMEASSFHIDRSMEQLYALYCA